MSKAKKYLRGDPDRPFPKDLARLQELAARWVAPTHEPLWFYRNRGSSSPREKRRAVEYKSIENIDISHRMGLQMPGRAQFFKGFGLVRERPFIEETIRYARELHKRGMMISIYVGGTMFTDYFFKEVPEALQWARVAQDGNPITYGGFQLQRWFPCLNNPGYRAYLKKVLDVAVQEVQADEIFFDNQILRHEPRSCRCEHCIEHVRAMVRRKYTLRQCEERYGLAEYPDIQPPIWSQACPPWGQDIIRTPQIQDWIDHRCASVIDFYRDMAEHVKAQNPAVSVGMNIKGVHGNNRAFDHGIDHGGFADLLDFSCIDGYDPGVKANGSISSEVRFWKSSHSTHIAVVDSQHTDLTSAEGNVYGYRKFIRGHGWLGDMGNCDHFSPLTQFFRGHQRLFVGREHLHDVAVLRYEPATHYNCARVHEQLMAFEQTLAVEKIPWGIIYDAQIDQLKRHRIVALPEIQALSDEWIAALDAFMRKGGGVIASGAAGTCDHWYRSRDPGHTFARWLGHAPGKNYESAGVGRGRFVYVPRWRVQTPWDFHDWFSVWGDKVFPVMDRSLFLKAIDDATVGRPLTHQAAGPDCVWIEAIAHEKGVRRGLDLHLINYDPAKCGANVVIGVALPAGAKSARVTVVDPEGARVKTRTVRGQVDRGVVRFAVAAPRVYGLVQVAFR